MLLEYLTLEYIIPVALGLLLPFLMQKLKLGPNWISVLSNPKISVFVVGSLGALIALGLNPLLVLSGFAEKLTATAIVTKAFAITATVSQTTYHAWIKPKAIKKANGN